MLVTIVASIACFIVGGILSYVLFKYGLKAKYDNVLKEAETEAEVMQSDDNPPIGILLCTEKGDTLVKYATAGLDPNIFVQKYRIELPTEEEIKEFISSSNYESYKL